MTNDEAIAASVDALFDARAKIRDDLRLALAKLDHVDEQATAMLQIATGRLVDLGAGRDLVRQGVEAMFAVDEVLHGKTTKGGPA